ncbi:hypothetical protein OG233_01430 [Streptomyces sp. NBC_01218]|nr:hypothetical protein OG233_01430 [Streptomyces sp. NBC_01218]
MEEVEEAGPQGVDGGEEPREEGEAADALTPNDAAQEDAERSVP